MKNSLLAFLFPRIKGSQEDIATISLYYILGQSDVLRSAFTKMISRILHLDYKPLSYSTQVVGKQKERPDIVGLNNEKEEIIIEAKFFAALTENQPGTYIERLNGDGGLIFICPVSRRSSLWEKIKPEDSRQLGEYCVDVNGTHLAIVSWTEVFQELQSCADDYAPETIENLHQLIGFCKEMEDSEFIPFKEEDFGPDIARSIDRYYRLVDETTNKILQRKDVSATKNKLHATPQWFGYTQYINIEGLIIGVYFHRDIWKKSSLSSPFCISFFSDKEYAERYINSLESKYIARDNYNIPYIVIEPPVGLTLDEAAEYMTEKVIKYVKAVKMLHQ